MSNATNPRRHLNAPRAAAYRALLDARAIAQWKVPDGMSCHLHEFEAREGGRFRVSLTYQTASGAGKTSSRTDTYHGRFVELVPDEKVVEVVEFETNDPTLHGEMRIATTLKDVSGGPSSARPTKGCRAACRRPTTKPAGAGRLASSRRRSKPTNAPAERPPADGRRLRRTARWSFVEPFCETTEHQWRRTRAVRRAPGIRSRTSPRT